MVLTAPASCVIGFRLSTPDPRTDGYWLDKYRVDGAYRIEEVQPEAVEAFISDLVGRGYVGANVTMPYKDAAFAFRSPTKSPSHRRGQHAVVG